MKVLFDQIEQDLIGIGAEAKTTAHFYSLMNYFLFDIDPENAVLEAEKDACLTESKIRREEKLK